MSNRPKTATQRRAERARAQREAVLAERTARQDDLAVPEYGIALAEKRSGLVVEWSVGWEPYSALIALAHLRDVTLSTIERDLVATLRNAGVSWDSIGFALGISGEAARRRFVSVVVEP